MKVTTIAIAALLTATSGAASAQTATDAQCLILSNVFAKQAKDAQSQKAAEAAVYFYMGRVRSGITATQLKTLLETSAKPITDANAGPKMNDCIKAVQTTGQLLQSIAPPPPASNSATAVPTAPSTQPQNQPQGR